MTQTGTREDRIGGSEDLSAVRQRFGKGDFIASVTGMFTGLGVLVFLGALLAAGRASIDFQLNVLNPDGSLDEGSVIGLIVAAAVVFASFFIGGYAAGRMARYDGGLNGLGAGLWMLLLVAIFAALGAWVGAEFNAFNRIDLPNWFAQMDADDLTLAAVVSSVVLIAAMLISGYLGGRIGELYHRRADAAIVQEVKEV